MTGLTAPLVWKKIMKRGHLRRSWEKKKWESHLFMFKTWFPCGIATMRWKSSKGGVLFMFQDYRKSWRGIEAKIRAQREIWTIFEDVPNSVGSVKVSVQFWIFFLIFKQANFQKCFVCHKRTHLHTSPVNKHHLTKYLILRGLGRAPRHMTIWDLCILRQIHRNPVQNP